MIPASFTIIFKTENHQKSKSVINKLCILIFFCDGSFIPNSYHLSFRTMWYFVYCYWLINRMCKINIDTETDFGQSL